MSEAPDLISNQSDGPLTGEQIREQIQRILDSEPFQWSEIQRRLLKYLSEKSLSGEADQLKEYTVGIEGIGKASTYDPRRDSTVRLQTGKLRQKLTEYYLSAGQNDPVLIDFPKGHFKLIFTPRQRGDATTEPLRRSNRRTVIGAALFAVVFTACIAAAWHWRSAQAHSPQSFTPNMEQFWGPLAGSSKPTVICLGTPMFVRLGDSGFYRDSSINEWNAAEQSGLIRKLQQPFPGAKAEPWYVFTTLGEAGAAFTLGKTLSTRMPNLQLANSIELSWTQIRDDNVIFVGPNRFNQQISELPLQQDFALETAGIRTLRPHPGDPSLFEDANAKDRSGVAYALISRLPGLHEDGYIVTLAGAGIPGTLAATEFATNEAYLGDMFRHIRLRDGRLPRYYQIVVQCKYKQWLPIEISYVSHHVLKD